MDMAVPVTYPNAHLAGIIQQLNIQRNYVKGEGAWLEDEHGQRVLDFLSGYGSLPFGHNPAPVNQAVAEFLGAGRPVMVQMSNSALSLELVRRLGTLLPQELHHVVFANSGAETTECALKAARSATGRPKTVTAQGGFHGKTLGALAATGQPHYQEGFFVSSEHFHYVAYDDLVGLRAVLEADAASIAAVLVEPLQGEGGVIAPSPGYLAGVRALCDEFGVLMIVDEVQTGLGRTGAMFASLAQGVVPDALLIAKALGGGLVPIGACVMNDKMYQREFGLRHTSTFAGNGLACAVGIAVIDVLTHNDQALVRHVREMSAYLRRGLQAVLDQHRDVLPAQLRGQGLMLGVHFDLEGRQGLFASPLLNVIAETGNLVPLLVSHLLNEEGVRVAPTLNGKNVLRVQPPLTVQRDECDVFIGALDRTLSCVASSQIERLLACFFTPADA